MGIESDQVVYEYLSRVGDVAQQRQLSSATRMRLVSELRNEIDRRRAKATVDSPAAVRRILDRLGSPDEVVAAAGAGGDGSPRAAAPAVPVQREPEADEERPRGLRRAVPRPRPARPEPPRASSGAAPPHLATAAELGGAAIRSDWWRTDGSPFALGDDVPGFVGGVEIPELLKPPPAKNPSDAQTPGRRPVPAPGPAVEAEAEADAAAVEAAEAAGPDAQARRRRLPVPLRPGRWSNPLLLLAAGLLVAGAVLGNWFALLLGWAIAYASRRLTPAESKWAVVGMPGLAVAAGLVWLWGRTNGRWGDPIAQGHMNDAVAQTWPWVVRAAAVLSALFLVWRSQRQR
ncbi:hypothetical protein RKE30_39485 [Streptomyces sp. Li-HN-5-11]|uniref:hypothetical protein n=1 Tax=Streptomyces sp. Li-HN-5-11 TaxID=3075432 RepID=UPI0028A92B8D|nr:hypothetical protein [Streptomyces sp. Li-HN-5-11]WNM36010.1 hypothetical protein RKE30_39485 [Streptomyces sp. Li-HN-5-11]